MISLKGNTEGVVQLGWRAPLLTQSIKDLKEKKKQQTVSAKSHSCVRVFRSTICCNNAYFTIVK